MSHGQTWSHKIHKTHHGPNLGEATTFPLIVFFVPNHKANTQMSFCMRKPKLRLLLLWKFIALCVNLRLMWALKKSCSPHWKLSKSMWHMTYLQGNQGDFRLFSNLSLDPSFGHNLCFKYPNASCEPILHIYIPLTFLWYKELFNAMGFNAYSHSLEIRESIETPTSKVGIHLWVWRFIPSFSHTPKSMKCDYLGSFLAHTFASPCLGD